MRQRLLVYRAMRETGWTRPFGIHVRV